MASRKKFSRIVFLTYLSVVASAFGVITVFVLFITVLPNIYLFQALLSDNVWNIVLPGAVLALITLWRAYKRLQTMELDYKGPEVQVNGY